MQPKMEVGETVTAYISVGWMMFEEFGNEWPWVFSDRMILDFGYGDEVFGKESRYSCQNLHATQAYYRCI